MNPRTKATIQMLVCASLWSIAGIFIKIIPWNPFVIAGWRSLISAATVLVYLRANRVSFRFNRHSVINGVMMSATFLCFVAANKLTTAANAIVLQFTAPVFILIFSAVLLHQKFKKGDVLVVVCTMAGISLFFFDQLEGGYLLGNCVAILAGAFMASMFLAVSHADEESRMGGMILGHLFTAAAGLPFMLFTENPVTPAAVASILVLGVIQLGIPYILFTLAMKHCPPLACSLLSAVEPLLNPVWVFLFDGEAPGLFALFGGVIVIVSITCWTIFKEKAAAEEPPSV